MRKFLNNKMKDKISEIIEDRNKLRIISAYENCISKILINKKIIDNIAR